ncbi:MAG: serine/threonine-protein kinase, partial [Myxococcota bacterium]
MDAPLSERPAILERACGDDASLRAEVEALLDADAAGDDDVMAGLGAAVAAVAGEVDDTAVELAEVGLARGAMVDGRYEVKEVLGRGGMGVVVGAEHTGLGEPVALKVLKPGAMTSERARRRFIREARAAAKMRSPHVVAVRDVGTLSSGAPYLVMDRLHGVDLATVIEQRGALPVDEASLIVLQVCEALATAHRRGVIHRDIKPANIFLERAEHGEVAVKLLDFGISKVVDEGDTLTGTSDLVGSPAYMSPEQ